MILSFLKELSEYWIYVIPLFFGGLSTFTYMFGRAGVPLVHSISFGFVILSVICMGVYFERYK